MHRIARLPVVSRPHLLSVVILLACAVAAGPAMAEGLVVFSAQGIDLKPGDVVDGDQPFTLKAGQSATLIAANGRIFRLSGPHDGLPDPQGGGNQPGMAEALKSLLVSSHAQESALGVTRSSPAIGDTLRGGWVPEPWLVDVTRSGNHCLREGQPVVFWRPDNERTEPVRVRIGHTIWSANTHWPAGTNRLAPPREMPVLDGEVYRVQTGMDRSMSRLHVIPATVQAPAASAAWMAEKGCDAQAQALLRTLQ